MSGAILWFDIAMWRDLSLVKIKSHPIEKNTKAPEHPVFLSCRWINYSFQSCV